MNTSIVLDKALRKAVDKKNISQKELAKRSFMAYTTTNGHFNGYPVTLDNSTMYSKELNDSEFAFTISHEMLGLMSLVDGCVIKKDALALNAFQRREAKERKEVESSKEIACLLGTEISQLTDSQKSDILCHSLEFADELLFETSQICKELEMIGMSFMDLMKQKIPYWKQQNWIE